MADKITLGQAKALRALLECHREEVEKLKTGAANSTDEVLSGEEAESRGFATYFHTTQFKWRSAKSQTGWQRASSTVMDTLRKAGLVEDQPYEARRYWTSQPPVRITVAGVEAVTAFEFPPDEEFSPPETLPELVDVRTGERWKGSGQPGRVIGNVLYRADQLRGDGKPKRGAWAETIGVRLGRGSFGAGEEATRGLMPPVQEREEKAKAIRRRIAEAQQARRDAEHDLFALYDKGE